MVRVPRKKIYNAQNVVSEYQELKRDQKALLDKTRQPGYQVTAEDQLEDARLARDELDLVSKIGKNTEAYQQIAQHSRTFIDNFERDMAQGRNSQQAGLFSLFTNVTGETIAEGLKIRHNSHFGDTQYAFKFDGSYKSKHMANQSLFRTTGYVT